MNEIREFILEHYRVAVIGMLDWNDNPDGIMYGEYYRTASVCERMLRDTGMTYDEIFDYQHKVLTAEVDHRNVD